MHPNLDGARATAQRMATRLGQPITIVLLPWSYLYYGFTTAGLAGYLRAHPYEAVQVIETVSAVAC